MPGAWRPRAASFIWRRKPSAPRSSGSNTSSVRPRSNPPAAAFPACLNDAPLLLPGQNTTVRGEIDRWLGEARLHPRIVGEFDDSALMKVFGEAGEGCFPAPALLSDEICACYGVREAGRQLPQHDPLAAGAGTSTASVGQP